jgi:hypothetical protein
MSTSNVRPINIELAVCKKPCTTNITTMLGTINVRSHTHNCAITTTFSKGSLALVRLFTYIVIISWDGIFFLFSPRWMMHHPTRGIISLGTSWPSYLLFEHSHLVLSLHFFSHTFFWIIKLFFKSCECGPNNVHGSSSCEHQQRWRR